MNTFFAVLNGAPSYQLIVGDDNEDLRAIVSRGGWREISETYAVAAYKTSTERLVVFLLDAQIRPGPYTTLPIAKWMESNGLANDPTAGRLLILYSGDPPSVQNVHRSYIKSERMEDDIGQIIDLVDQTSKGRVACDDWPNSLARQEAEFSVAIHGLENLLLPLRTDLGTLVRLRTMAEKEYDSAIGDKFKAIWSDYFGSRKDGYLAIGSSAHEGTNLINYVTRVCSAATAKADPTRSGALRIALAAFCDRIRAIQREFGCEPEASVRVLAVFEHHVEEVLQCGTDLIGSIRDLRKEAANRR